MAGRPKERSKRMSVVVTIRLPEMYRALLEAARGKQDQGEYLRGLVIRELNDYSSSLEESQSEADGF